MTTVDCAYPRVHHELHGVAVSNIAGGVALDALTGGLEVGKEPLVQLPLDAQHPPPGKEGDLRLCVIWGHAALVEDTVDLVLCSLCIGVDSVGAECVDGEAHRCGALLLLGRCIDDEGVLLACSLLARLRLCFRLLGGSGSLCHVVLDAVVCGSVVGGILVVVLGSVVVVIIAVVIAVIAVCDLEMKGRNLSNGVSKKEKIDIILYLLLVGGTHSECPRALAIGRSCRSCNENYVRCGRGSILRGCCRCILFRQCVQCQPFQCQ